MAKGYANKVKTDASKTISDMTGKGRKTNVQGKGNKALKRAGLREFAEHSVWTQTFTPLLQTAKELTPVSLQATTQSMLIRVSRDHSTEQPRVPWQTLSYYGQSSKGRWAKLPSSRQERDRSPSMHRRGNRKSPSKTSNNPLRAGGKTPLAPLL